ncbi:hypothetical protein BWK60_07735 [Flavobacterium covae]|uniref:hypothetical protein n=1 Tax=Flavobacterium covae TaxID=2906076 RepID=UPI000B4C9EC4|nr:hypothetical protein [Flavobacterium covae]OWP86663.1 hypothetical protein BWK60_07735 [Flavobacterium covae]
MKLKHEIDFKGLENYLKSLRYSDIETNWQKPKKAKLIKGHSIEEIEYFKTDKSKIPLEKVINYGEPFLIDALGNDLSIVILSKREYKLPTGRKIHAKFVTTIIDDCREIYGTPLSGYWKIPNNFLKRINKYKQKFNAN